MENEPDGKVLEEVSTYLQKYNKQLIKYVGEKVIEQENKGANGKIYYCYRYIPMFCSSICRNVTQTQVKRQF